MKSEGTGTTQTHRMKDILFFNERRETSVKIERFWTSGNKIRKLYGRRIALDDIMKIAVSCSVSVMTYNASKRGVEIMGAANGGTLNIVQKRSGLYK